MTPIPLRGVVINEGKKRGNSIRVAGNVDGGRKGEGWGGSG